MLGVTLADGYRDSKAAARKFCRLSNESSVDFQYHPLLGLVAAAVLGGAVGIQRQAAQKPAGFRTHLLVAAACAAFAAISVHYHDTRIAANVLTGIGFIGAGAIVRSGLSAQGVTTAASIWTVAAIGVACGFGEGYGLSVAVLLTVIAVSALSFSDSALVSFLRFHHRATVGVQLSVDEKAADDVRGVLEANGMRYEPSGTLTANIDRNGGSVFMEYLVEYRDPAQLRDVLEALIAVDGVARVRLNEPFPNG